MLVRLMGMSSLKRTFADPRHGQIAALSCLILLGSIIYAFEMPWWRPITGLSAAIFVQWIAARALGWGFDWRSPTISALSLTLLLRTDGPWLVVLAALIAIGSKALIRVNGRHLFNPTALGIVITVLAFPGAWISPGQWGTAGWIVIAAAGCGLAVTYGARRLEVPLCFLAAWAALCFGRALVIGDPMAIPVHQMSSGALLVFAFFMISDPMTAPWNQRARITWVCVVAAIAFALQTSWIVTAGPLYGLVLAAPLVPLLNALFPAPVARWRPSSPASSQPKGAPTCVPS
ncbi:MAG: RnfABCDGE type electron transport complex subunit D [Pseudomonadota bacterium]